VRVYVIVLKRLEFASYKKHTVCVFKEPDALLVLRMVEQEMERRMELLEQAGVVKVQDYEGLPYIALVIDEIAELQNEKAWDILNRLVRLARALGISVVAATQRPSTKVIDGDTRALFTARISFRVADEVNSRIILDGPQAAYLPTTPGRAIYRFGDRCREVQTMFLPVEKVRELLANMPGNPPPVAPTVKTKPAP
jgi:S-DNA-T family DNA segregation ATPase FtsK/SpoIIIE